MTILSKNIVNEGVMLSDRIPIRQEELPGPLHSTFLRIFGAVAVIPHFEPFNEGGYDACGAVLRRAGLKSAGGCS